MYQATITRQRQMSIPAKLMEMVGMKPGEKVDLIVLGTNGAKTIQMRKSSGWESLRGILSEFKGSYPTKKQLAKAHVAGLKIGKVRDGKNTGRHQRFAQVFG